MVRSVIVSTLMTVLCTSALAVDGDDVRKRAVELYDAGDYAAALPLLEQLDAAGDADGPLLYRLAFARSRTGESAGSADAQTRALAALEREYAEGGGIETAFYLSNAYRNVRRADDSRRVASETTARVESGKLAVPDDPLAWFRTGKLYEDQARHDRAVEWYERALEAMSREPTTYLGYLRWSHRYLGHVQFSRSDYVGAERHFAALTELDGSNAADWDALAVSRARLGRWVDADQAWVRAEQANPADANRHRYCSRVARLAADIGELPERLPDGRAVRSLSREELEAVMSEQAALANAVREELPTDGSLTEERRAELQERLDAARPVFVAAAMEYSLRRLPIRETAFFGGYAPLIFHADRWVVRE